MECIKTIGVWVLLLSAALRYTSGKPVGSVLVRLQNLENAGHTDYTGRCCRMKCRPCDYQLSIWVTCDGKTADSACLYGLGKTGIFYGTPEISFTQDLGNGSRNPLVYNFTSFQGNLGITILATNSNGSKIHSYRFHQSIYPTTYNKRQWRNATLLANLGRSNSDINLSYQVYCKEHYYSPSCTVGCLPGANYKCDKNSGKKLCVNGYVGTNCTCKPSHEYNCDITTGKRLCYAPRFGVRCDVKCQPRNDGLSGYNCDLKTGAKVCLRGWYGPECNETTLVKPRVSTSYVQSLRVSSIILAHNSQDTVSRTRGKSTSLLTTKSSVHHRTSMSRKIMSSTKITSTYVMSTLMTSSPLTSPLMTSSFMASSLMTLSPMTSSSMTSLMTSSTTTSMLVTSSSVMSDLLPSYVFSTHTESGMLRPKGTPMTIRNLTGQTEDSYPEITIFTTSYPVNLRSISSNIDFTKATENKLPGTSVDFTGTSEVIKDRTDIIGDQTRDLTKERTEITRDRTRLTEIVSQITEPTVTINWTSQDKTRHFEHHTEPPDIIPVITISEHETSSSTCCDVTGTPTLRDTTFRPGSTDKRKGKDVWWQVLVPLIVAIILIVTGVAVYKMKNRKRREVSPHYEASMQEFKAKPEEIKSNDHDQQNTRNISNGKNDKNSSTEDLEAIWRVMSTPHE